MSRPDPFLRAISWMCAVVAMVVFAFGGDNATYGMALAVWMFLLSNDTRSEP